MKFRPSAFDHGIQQNQIEDLIANKWGMTKWFAFQDDNEGNSQDMIVGFDAEATLLEVGITYINDDDVVFHADKATTFWKNRYDED